VRKIPAAKRLTLSGGNPSNVVVPSEKNPISETSHLEGPAMVRSKEYHFIQYWNDIHGIGI